MNGYPETRRSGRSDGIKPSYEITKEDKSFSATSSQYRATASPTFRNVKSPTSPALSSSRRYGSVDRDFDQHHNSDRNRSAPSPTTTVWLSKKMKEAAMNGFAGGSPLSGGDKQRSYSPPTTTRYERSKSDLEPSHNRRLNSLESPTESINFIISRRETPQYMVPDRELLSPRESVISRSSGRHPSDYRSKTSPSKDYKSLNEFSTSNLKSPDLFHPSLTRERDCSDPSKFYTDIYQSRDRSNSFHDLREPSSVLRDLPKSRVRHKTLAYGVSGQDLERAKLGTTDKGSDEDMKTILRELEDTGYFSKNNFSSMANETSSSHLHNLNTKKSIPSGTSSPFFPPSPSPCPLHPKYAQQVSVEAPLSPQTIFNLMNVQNCVASKPPSPHPYSFNQSSQPGPPTTLPLPRTLSHTSLPPHPLPLPAVRGPDISSIQDEALIVLKKHDLDSLLAEQKQKEYLAQTGPPPTTSGHDSWVKKKSSSFKEDVDYKKLALVNDDLLKMWEESQAENTRLRLELSGVKSDLETARYQLETAAKQVTKNNAVTDQEKREKQIVVKKLAEMEEELKLLALSENLTDQTLDQLKNDNARLRDENGALLRVIAKMSK